MHLLFLIKFFGSIDFHRGFENLAVIKAEFWGNSAEILHWWSITAQIWEAHLIGWNKFLPPHHQPEAQPRLIWVVTRHQYGISVLVPGTSFLRETSVGIKLLHHNCTYPSQVKRERRFLEMHIPKSRTNRKTLPIQVTEEGQWCCSHVQLMTLILLMKYWWWTESTGGEELECIDDVPLNKKLGTQWIHVTSQSLSE